MSNNLITFCAKTFLHPLAKIKGLKLISKTHWRVKVKGKVNFKGKISGKQRKMRPHLDLAPWLPPAASLDRTWVGQSQPNLEHSHSSKLMSQEKWNNLIFDRLTIMTLLFRGADNHYQLSGISLFLYFSLKFVNWISPRWLGQGKPLSPS